MQHLDRRTILTALAASAAGGLTKASAQQPPRYPLGVQFFTFNAYCGKGWDKFSEAMGIAKNIGYSSIEFAGVWGHKPETIRKRADELGLTLRSYHLGNDIVRAFQGPGPGGITEAQDATYTPIGVVQVCRATLGIARDLGVQYAGLGAAGVSNFTSIDSVKRLAEAFNKCGELASQAGMKFFYHNHAIDFKPINGQVPFDLLIAETDPKTVRFQLDTGWAGTEGADPLKTINAHPDRIDLIHLRDSSAQGQTTVPGDGIIDFRAVMTACQKIPAPIFIMESNAKPEAEAVTDATRAYAYLQKLGWGGRTA